MHESWAVIYQTPYLHEVEIIKSIMADNEIECVIMNKMVTSHFLGEIEIYVPCEEAFRAKQLIQNFQGE